MDLGHQTFPQPIPDSRPIDTLLLWEQHTPSRNTLLHQPNRLAYLGHVLMENRHGMVVDASVTQATGTAKREAAVDLVAALGGTQRITLACSPNVSVRKNSR